LDRQSSIQTFTVEDAPEERHDKATPANEVWGGKGGGERTAVTFVSKIGTSTSSFTFSGGEHNEQEEWKKRTHNQDEERGEKGTPDRILPASSWLPAPPVSLTR